MDINQRAPAAGTSYTEVAADPTTVWAVLTDVRRWPEWNPDVKHVSLDGELGEGSTFRWKAGPSTITSTVLRMDKPRLLAWCGKTLGINAIHVWRMELQDGKTNLTSQESWEGFVVSVFRGPMRKMLKKSLDSGLWHLKTEAERRAVS